MSTLTIISVDGSILIKSPEFIQKKTVLDILKSVPQLKSDDSLLAIKTPTYMKILQPNSIPYETYPDLIRDISVDLHSIPDFYLQILHSSAKGKFFLIFNPTSPENPEIIFPPFIFSFVPSDYSDKKMSTFISDVVIRFGISISNPKIIFKNKEIPPEQDFKNFFTTVSEYVKNCLYDPTGEKMRSIDFQFKIEPKGLKKIKYRETVLKEILDTEESYCSVLRSLNDYFQPLFKEHKIMNDEDHEALFGPIPQMIETSVYFSSEMCKLQNYSSCVAPTFLNTLFNFKQTSIDYFVNYNLRISDIVSTLDTNPIVQKICDESPNNPGISFQSVVIQPIQRFPRYPLLLKELLKRTPQSHPDFYLLRSVNVQVESMVHELADAHLVREMERLKERLIEGENEPSIFTQERSLMKFFSVHFREKPKTVFSFIESVKCTLYLFNDLLLLTSGNEKENELMRCYYDKFVFIPNYPDDLTITFQTNDDFNCIEFSSVKDVQIFRTLLTDCRQKVFESNDYNCSVAHSIKATEYFPSEEQEIHPMYDSSCCKSSDSIYSVSRRNFNVYKIDDHLFASNDTIKSLHKHSKLVIVGDSKYVFGGSKNVGPFEIIDDKVIEAKPKNSSENIKLELMEKLGAAKISVSKEGRIYHTCCAYKDFIVVFGGINPRNSKKDAYEMHFYSVETGDWYEIKSTNKVEPRYKHSAVVYKDTMIIHGGINSINDQIMKDTWSFNFLDGSWTLIELSDDGNVVPRFGHSAVIVNHFMFVIGGLTAGSSYTDTSQNDGNNTSSFNLFNFLHHHKDSEIIDDQNESNNSNANIHHHHHNSGIINEDNLVTDSTVKVTNENCTAKTKEKIENEDQKEDKNDVFNNGIHNHHHLCYTSSIVDDDNNSNQPPNDAVCDSIHHHHHHHHHHNNNNNSEIKERQEQANDDLSENDDAEITKNNICIDDNEYSSDNIDIDDTIDFISYLSKNCVPAPKCFCLNIMNDKIDSIEIAGNFITGISMFSAVYDESNGQIVTFGGRDPKKHFDKGIPIVTFLDIPQHYVNINPHLKQHAESEALLLSSHQHEKSPHSTNADHFITIENKKHKRISHSVSTVEETKGKVNHDMFDELTEKQKKERHQNHRIIKRLQRGDQNDELEISDLHQHHHHHHHQIAESNSTMKRHLQHENALHHHDHDKRTSQEHHLHRKNNNNNKEEEEDDDDFLIKLIKRKHKGDLTNPIRNFPIGRFNYIRRFNKDNSCAEKPKTNNQQHSKHAINRNSSINSSNNRQNSLLKEVDKSIKTHRRSSSLQNSDFEVYTRYGKLIIEDSQIEEEDVNSDQKDIFV